MELKDIRNKLKECQPYFIEKELIDKLYWNEEVNFEGLNIDYWSFFYAFIRKLSDKAIGVRMGYAKPTINNRIKKILERNKYLITEFLLNHSQYINK